MMPVSSGFSAHYILPEGRRLIIVRSYPSVEPIRALLQAKCMHIPDYKPGCLLLFDNRFLFVRYRLYRRRLLHPTVHFAAFFEIYKINTLSHRYKFNFLQMFDDLLKFRTISVMSVKFA